MTAVLWLVAGLLMLVGLVGTVLPALPGVPLIFVGVLLAASIDDFSASAAGCSVCWRCWP